MGSEELVEGLKTALQIEYSDVFLYPRQAEAIKDKEMSEKFERFGRMELRHADNIAMQILTLKGTPTWEFYTLDAKKTLEEILLWHREYENKCIRMYERLIDLADREDEDQLKLVLKGIKTEEEGHSRAIDNLIKNINIKR